MIYVDTSVLVAYYCPERLSARAQRLLQEQHELSLSSLVEVELASALAGKVRSRQMRLADARRVHALFQVHLEEGMFTRLALERLHFSKAYEWLATFRTPLRTLDALHVAVAAAQGATLLTADTTLAKACSRVGVTTRVIG